jgi:predicted nucleic acid-binding protein
MKPKVYVETTVISYLTAWRSRDLVMAAHQQVTEEWWRKCPGLFELVASELVVREASAGDPAAAQERLKALAAIPLLAITEPVADLAQKLIEGGALPEKAADDAFHVAVAVANGVDYLVTWNCKHIANATMRPRIEAVCRAAGYQPVMICTPDQLLGE